MPQLIAQPRKANLLVGAGAVYLALQACVDQFEIKDRNRLRDVGPHMINSKAHDIARYDGMRMIESVLWAA